MKTDVAKLIEFLDDKKKEKPQEGKEKILNYAEYTFKRKREV